MLHILLCLSSVFDCYHRYLPLFLGGLPKKPDYDTDADLLTVGCSVLNTEDIYYTIFRVHLYPFV